MFIRLILLKFSRIFSSADISLQNTKGGRFPGAYLFSYHGFIQIYKHFYNLPNIKHLCDLSSIKQTSPVQDSVRVTTRSPAVDTHQVSDYPEYFDVGLLQEKPLGDEYTLRSLADQAQLCGWGGDQGLQALSHKERSVKIMISN